MFGNSKGWRLSLLPNLGNAAGVKALCFYPIP